MHQIFLKAKSHLMLRLMLFLGISILIINNLTSAATENSIFKPYTKATLENGLTLIVKENHSAPIAAIDIRVAVGSVNESPDQAGISHFVEHMLFKGTKRRKVGEIAGEIKAVGGVLDGMTSLDTTHYYVVVPSEYLELALDVEADAIQNSVFAPEEIDRERNVVFEDIRIHQDRPSGTLGELMLIERLYAGTPYAHNLVGTPETLNNINRDALLAHYHKYYIPNNMTIAVVGDVDTDKVMSRIKELFKDFKPQKLVPPPTVELSTITKIIRFELQKDIRQSYFYIGFPTPPLNSKDIATLGVLKILLGGCKSARLNSLYSEELIRSISVEYLEFRDMGVFRIYAETQNAELLEKRIQAILRKVVEEGVTDKELAMAKAVLQTGYALDTERVLNLAFMMSSLESYGSIEDGVEYERCLQEVTKEDIQRVAGKYINLNAYKALIIKPMEVK